MRGDSLSKSQGQQDTLEFHFASNIYDDKKNVSDDGCEGGTEKAIKTCKMRGHQTHAGKTRIFNVEDEYKEQIKTKKTLKATRQVI